MEKEAERKNKWEILLAPPLIKGHKPAENRHSLCQATPSAPPPLVFLPNAAQMGQMAYVFFFSFLFFFCFIVMIWLILRLCFWVCILIMLEFRDIWEKRLLCLKPLWMFVAVVRGERKNCFLLNCMIFFK